MPGTDEHAEQLVDKPLAAVAAAQKAHPGVRVEQFGDASATKEIAAQDAKDGKKSELISYGLMLIILLVAFGAFVAAGAPARARRHRRRGHDRPARAAQPALRRSRPTSPSSS